MALLSLMARLGSADPVEPRASLDEILDGFDLAKFGAAPTKFDAEDLWPLTARVLSALPAEAVAADLAAAGVPEARRAAFWAAVKDNVGTRAEIAGWARLLAEGAEPVVADEDREFVRQAFALLPAAALGRAPPGAPGPRR